MVNLSAWHQDRTKICDSIKADEKAAYFVSLLYQISGVVSAGLAAANRLARLIEGRDAIPRMNIESKTLIL